MKLNNKGWGTSTMILLSLGLLVALLVAVFFISALYGSFGNSIGNRKYLDLENQLENAAGEYIRKNDVKFENEITIYLSTLQEAGLINEFKDSDGNDCNGYVVITKPDLVNIYEGRINCSNYTSRNY